MSDSNDSEPAAQENLRVLSEPHFQALLELAPDAMVIVDEAGRMVIINGQAERLFQYQRAELIGQPVDVLLPERLRSRHAQHRAGYSA